MKDMSGFRLWDTKKKEMIYPAHFAYDAETTERWAFDAYGTVYHFHHNLESVFDDYEIPCILFDEKKKRKFRLKFDSDDFFDSNEDWSYIVTEFDECNESGRFDVMYSLNWGSEGTIYEKDILVFLPTGDLWKLEVTPGVKIEPFATIWSTFGWLQFVEDFIRVAGNEYENKDLLKKARTDYDFFAQITDEQYEAWEKELKK